MDSNFAVFQAFDALFPIGAYTMSGGLETYAQLGIVRDRESLLAYLKAQLFLLPYGDLGVAAKAAMGEDFRLLDDICAAMKQAEEIRLGSRRLCSRFIKTMEAMEAIGESVRLAEYRQAIAAGACEGHYPVAAGLYMADAKAELPLALGLYCYGILSTAANHAVKLVPLGQMDGQKALRAALGGAGRAVGRAVGIPVGDLGVSGFGFELRAMQHEKLPGRMYIS